MIFLMPIAPAELRKRIFAAIMASAVSVAVAGAAYAQQPAAPSKAGSPPAQPQQAVPDSQIQLVYVPWTKVF